MTRKQTTPAKPKAVKAKSQVKGKPAKVAAAKPAKPASNGNGHGNGIAPTVIAHSIKTKCTPHPKPEIDRDDQGRFLAGHSVGGRPIGSKNKLIEDFLADFHGAWKEHGTEALKVMATKEQSSFVRAAVQLMPKDVLVDARGAGLIVVKLDDIDMNL